ncbi:MAG: DUF535 family protein [Betaproteobacteria bacterium]|nr:DUF535 family protein [Betaproteobacteria bacterium]
MSRSRETLNHSSLKFFTKFTGRYFAKFLSPREKLMIQCNHYAFLDRIISDDDFFLNIKKGITIWTQEYNTCNDKQSIVLKTPNLSKREGEIVLEYFFNNTLLYFITFSFSPGTIFGLPNEQLIAIGGSQGRYSHSELTRNASKLNGEINPSTALILALKAISRVLGIKILLGIKVSQHSSLNINPEIGYFSYDDLWSKNYGEEYPNYYVIPTDTLRKVSDTVEGSHKSRTRKKRIRKEDMINQIMSEFERYVL